MARPQQGEELDGSSPFFSVAPIHTHGAATESTGHAEEAQVFRRDGVYQDSL